MSVAIQRDADDKDHPDGLVTAPKRAQMHIANSCAVTTPTSATIVTDADGWASVIAEGFTNSASAGTITCLKAGLYRAAYGLSDITVVNGQVLTSEIYVGTTASKGKCKQTQLTAAPASLNGSTILTLAVGDVVTIKIIADTGNFTCAAGFLEVIEL